MKKLIFISALVIMLSSVGCNKVDAPSDIAPEEMAQSFYPENVQYIKTSSHFVLDDSRYDCFTPTPNYSVNYYFPEGVRLTPIDKTVAVHETHTCGTGLPEDYDSFMFDAALYTTDDDVYGDRLVFIKDPDKEVYYPFSVPRTVVADDNDTFQIYIDKLYGDGEFDKVTDLRLARYGSMSEFFAIPETVATDIKTTVRDQKTGDINHYLCGCTYYWDTDKHMAITFVMPTTRYEYSLTFCPNDKTLGGIPLSDTLAASIHSCVSYEYQKNVLHLCDKYF